MNMKNTCFAVVVVITIAIGCAGVLPSGFNYDVNVQNTGKQPIPGSKVISATGFMHEPGYLSPGARKSISGPFKFPYADKWTVAWETSTGEKFKKTLDLTKEFPRSFEGRIFFVIDATNGLSFYATNFPGR